MIFFVQSDLFYFYLIYRKGWWGEIINQSICPFWLFLSTNGKKPFFCPGGTWNICDVSFLQKQFKSEILPCPVNFPFGEANFRQNVPFAQGGRGRSSQSVHDHIAPIFVPARRRRGKQGRLRVFKIGRALMVL